MKVLKECKYSFLFIQICQKLTDIDVVGKVERTLDKALDKAHRAGDKLLHRGARNGLPENLPKSASGESLLPVTAATFTVPVYEQMNTSQRSIHIKARRPSARYTEDSAIDVNSFNSGWGGPDNAFLAPFTTADAIGGVIGVHTRDTDGFAFIAPIADVQPIVRKRPNVTPVIIRPISPIRAHFGQLRAITPVINLDEARFIVITPEIRLRRLRDAYLSTPTINVGFGYAMVIDMLEWVRHRQVHGLAIRVEGQRLGWDFERQLGLGKMELNGEMHMYA
jgi:hypothetical protein